MVNYPEVFIIICFSVHCGRVRSALRIILKIRSQNDNDLYIPSVTSGQDNLPHMVKPNYSDINKSSGSILVLLPLI